MPTVDDLTRSSVGVIWHSEKAKLRHLATAAPPQERGPE